MKHFTLIISALVLSLALAPLKTKRTWNFDKDIVGGAAGFGRPTGEWKVVASSDAPSKPNVFAQLGKNSGSTFNLALVTGTNYEDLEISVKMKAVGGREDQGGGLVWRAKDKNNYYVVRFNPLEDNYRVYKVEKGLRTQLGSAIVAGDKNWHSLRVTMIGDVIGCSIDGKRKLGVRDSTFLAGGMIGLWTKADAQTQFDDLTVGEIR